MKLSANLILLMLFLNSLNCLAINPFFDEVDKDSSSIKSMLNYKHSMDKIWPDCPEVKDVYLVELDSITYILRWERHLSDRVEYLVRIRSNSNVVQETRNNSGVFVFQIDKNWSLADLEIDIVTMCYFDNIGKPLESESNSYDWSNLFDKRTHFCNSYEDLINRDDLPSFATFDTNLPKDVNFVFDVCVDDECSHFNHSTSKSLVLMKKRNDFSIIRPKLYTKYGNFECTTSASMASNPCDGIVVKETENCLYTITYPDSITPACDLRIFHSSVTHSLCGEATGRIVIIPMLGNAPYHYSWSNGEKGFDNEIDNLLPGTYTVTVTDVTGCEVSKTVVIEDRNTVRFDATGGNDGMKKTLNLKPGTKIEWRFDPLGVSDQIKITGNGLNVDTGPITRNKKAYCVGNPSCSCSTVFMGDYADGASLPIPVGTAVKSGIFAKGTITVPQNGIVNIEVLGPSCAGSTGWSVYLDCSPQTSSNIKQPKYLGYVEYPDEVSFMLATTKLTKEEYLRDSVAYFKLREIQVDKNSSRVRSISTGTNTKTLDFRCSGFSKSPYHIRMKNKNTGSIFTCKIIDKVHCPECKGCDLMTYSVNPDPWDPTCIFDWNVEGGTSSNLKVFNKSGNIVLQSSKNNDQWTFNSGENYKIVYEVENDTVSNICSFEIGCPEPNLPPLDGKICEFFRNFSVSLENESSLYFNSESSLTITEIEEFNGLLAQISTIDLNLQWNLGPTLYNHPLFNANNFGLPNLFQLDPENMTFMLEDYDMSVVWNQIMQGELFSLESKTIWFEFVITDVNGKIITCKFRTTVDFPQEDKEDKENPLCLKCDDGIYNLEEDLAKYSLNQGAPYAGSLNDKTIHIYGFPILVTSYNASLDIGEGILSLPFEKCKVLAVNLKNLQIVEFPDLPKKYWVKSGDILPKSLYPGQLPEFNLAPDFVIGAEICVPPRSSTDVDGDGIDDVTKLNKYGFNSNGIHINGTKLDNNGFDVNGNYMGCPRTDNPDLECSKYNDNGCNRDGLDVNNKPCPSIDEEEWTKFINKFNESSDSTLISILCDIAGVSKDKSANKKTECDSLRTHLNGLITSLSLTKKEELLIKGQGNIYIDEGMSQNFDSAPSVPSISIGGRDDGIENVEKQHVNLYYCDLEYQPLKESSDALSSLCSEANTNELKSKIDLALKSLSNLDRQRLMLDENAFKSWIVNQIKDYIKSGQNITIGAATPQSIELNLFNQPIKAYYSETGIAAQSIAMQPLMFENINVMDAIDYQYKSGTENIFGVNKGFYVAQLGKYNEFNYSSLGGQEPIMIQNVQKSSLYSIYLVNFRFFVDKPALVDAYLELNDPKSDRKIYFAAKNVEYNPDGIEKARMELATTIGKFRISNAARGTILKGPKTFVDFNCSGVNQIGLSGEVEFCDNIIVPMQKIPNKNDFERHDSTYFSMGFEKIFTEWLEFETKIKPNSPFAMAKQEDVVWIVPEFSFDFSSSSSEFSSGFNVPSGFKSEFVSGTSLGSGWKGFYCPSLSAVLPAISKSENGNRYTAANVSNLLIDKYGVTCSAEVSTQVLGLGKPNMKSDGEQTGWSLSIDYFRIDAVQNFIVGGGLRGKVLTSLFKDDAQSALDYSAVILPGQQYKFSVSPKTNLEIPLLVAKANIERSAIDVLYDAQKESFTAKAKFSGNLKIINDAAGISLPYLQFTNLTVSNKKPYIRSGRWHLKGSSNSANGENSGNDDSGKYDGLPFSIEKLKFSTCEGSTILSSTVNIGFGINGDNSDNGQMKSSNIKISGDFGLKGKFSPSLSGIQGFKFDSAFLNGMSVSGNIGEAVKNIDVSLCWDKDHPQYGKTFYGSGKADILNFGELGIAAQFGEKDNNKYFFIDGFADLPKPIPIGGPVGVTRIGVGVSDGMRMENNATGDGEPNPDVNSGSCTPPSCSNNFGQTYSGYNYIVDPVEHLALRASIGFGMLSPPDDFIDGAAGFDISFNSSGGISKFGFSGEATFLQEFPGKGIKIVNFINEVPKKLLGEVDWLADHLNLDTVKPDLSGPVPIMARIEGNWDFKNKAFDLDAGAFLDWGVLQGTGANNALGFGKIYIGDGWQVHLGTHRSKNGVKLNLGSINTTIESYFMAGNPLSPEDPWKPYLPQEVKSLFSENDKYDGFTFLDNMPSSGAGFAFGVHFGSEFNARLPILGGFKAKLLAGIDVALISGFDCDQPIGLGGGGWYAMGQGYLYAGAGLHVLGVDLIKGEAGVLMNTGIGKREYSFFNGRMAVRGKFGIWPARFEITGNIDVEVGNQPSCNFVVIDEGAVAGVVGNISIVESTFPASGSKEVNTNLSNYVLNYSVPMGEAIDLVYNDTLQDQSIVERTMQYKVKIKSIKFTSTKLGHTQNFKSTNKGMSDKVKFYSSFASNDSIVVQVAYKVDIKAHDSNSFAEIITDQVLEYNFKTGPLSLRFDPRNIQSTWPESGMNNFYMDHRILWKNKPQGVVYFKNSFPWEIFQAPGVEVRFSLHQGENPEPIIDNRIDPSRSINPTTGNVSSSGYLFYDLPEDMANGVRYKVLIYAVDTSDVKHHLMDPIHFRTSLYNSLEEKFATADSLYYVEATPRWGSEVSNGIVYNYTCGFKYNLVSKDGAPESWDEYDSKYMTFGPVCDFDHFRRRPSINGTDFVDCEFNGLDEPPGWGQETQYEVVQVGDLLSVPNANNSLIGQSNSNSRSASAIQADIPGPINVSLNDVDLGYRYQERLYYNQGNFLLKGCQ